MIDFECMYLIPSANYRMIRETDSSVNFPCRSIRWNNCPSAASSKKRYTFCSSQKKSYSLMRFGWSRKDCILISLISWLSTFYFSDYWLRTSDFLITFSAPRKPVLACLRKMKSTLRDKPCRTFLIPADISSDILSAVSKK